MEILRVANLSFWYPDEEKTAIEDINLSVNEGEFILIVGPSGCGKSTLVRLFNRVIPDYYGGKIKGKVFLKGKNIRGLNKADIIKNVGMVYQHPEKQIVLEDVEREIAFGLENLNTEINKMKRNVAEAMSLLGLYKIKDKTTTEISGGEKQRVAIASVVSMDPDILLFDEPISQLDPISSEEVLNSIKKLNRDMGKTVILIEQRLDRCFDLADRIIFMEDGKIIAEGKPNLIPKIIDKKYFMPNISYIFKKAKKNNIPVNVKEARELISDKEFNITKECKKEYKENIIEVKKLRFQYEKGQKTLNNINFNLKKGEILAVMGENGAGKSTLFKIIAGVINRYKGQIKIKNQNIKKLDVKQRIKLVGYLSQNPNDYFGRENVFEEIAYTLRNIGEYEEAKVDNIIKQFNLEHLKDKNPRDLSGGEKQRVAIACTLVTEPEILILDEPTRGMDASAKDKLGEMIKMLAEQGKTIVLVTHDSDFAADYADTVMLMFNGEITALGQAVDILYDSLYYSPQVARVFKNKCKIIKSEDAVEVLKEI
ncbi:energy-coupling factor transporter ATPase [Clostridium aestuarii]|uniref:Energy-coupling factor transporter ATPase n=1 Tax=Clostridium aestuarii TaxID=338193 RepID=A0ABT4CV49_9CLOT|nr:energy-coupling factor transporter ATPase [Clostridium aestuarii]